VGGGCAGEMLGGAVLERLRALAEAESARAAHTLQRLGAKAALAARDQCRRASVEFCRASFDVCCPARGADGLEDERACAPAARDECRRASFAFCRPASGAYCLGDEWGCTPAARVPCDMAPFQARRSADVWSWPWSALHGECAQHLLPPS